MASIRRQCLNYLDYFCYICACLHDSKGKHEYFRKDEHALLIFRLKLIIIINFGLRIKYARHV